MQAFSRYEESLAQHRYSGNSEVQVLSRYEESLALHGCNIDIAEIQGIGILGAL